jgi:calcineurin-like phosphoesterase
VFGAPGRRAVETRLPGLRDELSVGFCIVNGENAADGVGLTAKLADKLLAAGADVVTLGNHVWRQRDLIPVLKEEGRVIRPANLRGPGTGLAVEEAADGTPVAVVNHFHAEATSEKVALARYLDGRVTAVIGTHTHVQTNDARVQQGGTAAITDAGMTGPHDSVIGVRANLAIERMRTGMPVRFHPADSDVRIEGVLIECDADGRAARCESLRIQVE